MGAVAAVAATIVIAAGLGVRGERAREASRIAAGAVDSSRFSTRPGQRATVTLTDGSTVTLGAESRLSVAPRFGEGRRVVVLEGDAFFDGARDTSAPFVVVANGAETRVLGTAFAVRGGRGAPEVSVAVVRGRVGIGSGDQSRVLGVGDVGRTAADGTTRVRHDPLEVAALTSWKDGWLTLVDAPVDEAAAAIGRWYDLDVQVPDARLRARRISASFHDEPAAAVLRSVGEVLDARVERTGNIVTIHSR
jgi:transmembrane sensor